MIGTQLGAYRVVQQLGQGGMGSIWIGEHVVLGRRAAVKVLHPALSTRPDSVARFFNEARATTEIVDPGIVQVFDFGQDSGGGAYIVMELLAGEALDRRLDRHGALGVTAALRIVRQVAAALAAAHARGIIHRDLKPENIFLVRDPAVEGGERAKLLDFGIAKLGGGSQGLTQMHAVLGTPMYMSPEQCRGASEVDVRSDLYSLGCVLFALITGRPPFDGDSMGELFAAHLMEPAPVPSTRAHGIAPEIDDLILRCLAKDPAERPGSALALVAELDDLIGGAEIAAEAGAARRVTLRLPAMSAPIRLIAPTAASAATPTAFRPAPRSYRTAVLAGCGVALAAIVALVVTYRLANRPPAAPASPPDPRIGQVE
ncbi:MAG TPA: serine/threonine-protein kinase [Kofleriaceae bacterium]|nr:serine/threonine-protein kinase [Kofleriaceae bacterium]